MGMTYDFRVVENSDGFRDTLAEDRGHGAVHISISEGTRPRNTKNLLELTLDLLKAFSDTDGVREDGGCVIMRVC